MPPVASSTFSKVEASLQGHALALDLVDPRGDALLRHLGLVVLVARQANELAAVNGLGLLVVVAIGRGRADNVRTLLLEGRGELIHRVAEVVAVASGVAEAEDRDLKRKASKRRGETGG